MSPFQLDDSRSCLLHDSVPQPDSNSDSVASTKLPILVAVNLSSFQSRQNRSLEVVRCCLASLSLEELIRYVEWCLQ
ncbi:hypothetical protein LINPERPRIM_LOCUS20 [Linum perenne]